MDKTRREFELRWEKDFRWEQNYGKNGNKIMEKKEDLEFAWKFKQAYNKKVIVPLSGS